MQENIRQDNIIGSRRFSNYFWGGFLALGGISFLLAGLSSYFKINLLPFANTTELVFIPQGVVMMFYGTLSLSLGIYTGATILWDIGSGYNEYNKLENLVKIVRKGFPGKNREILLTYPVTSVQAIGIKISEGLNPQRSIYLCLKDERKIPLTPVQQPNSISNLEKQAADLLYVSAQIRSNIQVAATLVNVAYKAYTFKIQTLNNHLPTIKEAHAMACIWQRPPVTRVLISTVGQ